MFRARAPAKVNLTLHVLGRRDDGYHELDSVVAFAGCAADTVTLEPGDGFALGLIDGPFARAAGPNDDNLVLKAARAAQARIEGLGGGVFSIVKRIPVAAGLGGGSADAGAALRLIAEANGLGLDDPRLAEAAAATGSDVPVCLVSRAARMTGRGEGVESVAPPAFAIVLANPRKGVSTAAVFSALGLTAGAYPSPCKGEGGLGREAKAGWGSDRMELYPGRSPPDPADAEPPSPLQGEGSREVLAAIAQGNNDLEPPARNILPEIGQGLDAFARTEGCRLARMSGSGATVFGLYDDHRQARRAARALRLALPGWWVLPSTLR